MKIAIMTDTNSNISFKEAEDLGVFVVPMPIIVDEVTYYEGINISDKEFYDILHSGAHVTTSQPAIGAITDMWDHLLQSYDEIIYIPMSSGLSSSCATARIIAEDYDGKVLVCDNRRISVLLRDAVLEAKKLVEMGYTAKQIVDVLENSASDSSIYICVDTLEYLKKGGRITPAAAAIGTVLSIKPILSIQGDKLDSFDKTRSVRKAREKIVEAIRNDINTRFADIDKNDLVIHTGGTGLSEETVASWLEEARAAFPGYDIEYWSLPLSIGTHTGPGAIAMGVSVINHK